MTRSALALLVLTLAPSPLWAHAYLVRSTPAPRAVLLRAPERIQLVFNERLEPRYSGFTLSDADGKAVETGAVAVDPKDARVLSAPLKPLPAGRYVVRYRVLSVDGHVVRGEVSFTVK